MHLLRRDPGLLWQQLHNRLQWGDEPVLAVLRPEFERRSVPGAAPWFRTRTRSRESEALVRTLAGHTGGVKACAFSPDGARVVSASGFPDTALKLWDAETGREIRTLEGHTDLVYACAFSPDGARVVSASSDETLKLWDAETGECLATLPLWCEATAAAHHLFRASVACGDNSGSVYLVDLVGITSGPLVVTAADLGNGPAVRCPVCLERHPLRESWLGRELYCPGNACDAPLRVNPFIAGRRVPR
jgi:hypothetical protein